MKCPYCEKEMSKGCLYNGSQPVQWIPDGGRPSWLKFTASPDGVSLDNRFTLRSGYAAEAHDCHACQLVIAPTALHRP